MQRSAIVFSTLMHIAFFVLAYVGLPDWWESVVIETPIPVQMVENISDVTSPAPAQETVETPPPPEPVEEQAEEQPPPPAPTPPPAPQPVEEVPVTEPEEVVPEPIPQESVEEDEPEPEPEPQEVQIAEQPPAKPTPPEDVPEPQEEPEDDAFENLLLDLENVAETQTAQAEPTQTQSETPPIPTSSSSDNLSISAKDAMRRKVISCWNIDPGTRDAEDMLIIIRLWLNPDGSIQNVKIEDDGSWGGNPVYRAASESAQRAVLRCAPYYDVLGSEPYDEWSFMTLRFSPKDLLR